MVITFRHNWLGHLHNTLAGAGTSVDSPQLSSALSRPTGFAVVDLHKCSAHRFGMVVPLARGPRQQFINWVAGSLPSGLETSFFIGEAKYDWSYTFSSL